MAKCGKRQKFGKKCARPSITPFTNKTMHEQPTQAVKLDSYPVVLNVFTKGVKPRPMILLKSCTKQILHI